MTACSGSRYVPPHLRKRTETNQDSEEAIKLSRQLKGLLNRLSEQNISGILDEIEEIYRKHRRHDVTEKLTDLIINGISSHSSLLDSYVVLHAALISSLHKIVGVEFAASFVQNVVASYEKHYSLMLTSTDNPNEVVEDDSRGKECSNLIVLLSELYNFQVISCVLVYDVIRTLLNAELTELNVELLLKLLRSSGQQLRQDDPSALKDIVQIVQAKTLENEASSSSRTRFMVETLINLKNNKTKRAATQHAGGDSVDRLKKFLVGLNKKRHVMANDPLRVTLDDLHSAESRGKWWLVGAAWGGDPLAERQDQHDAAPAMSQSVPSENALLKLAKKQGMNTDIRRSIFVVLMSSDDYVDACERLAQLNLKEIQQREIIRVILHCCGNEKTYNPYYTFIAQHLCKMSHSYKVTLQFCLWDFLRDLGETTVGGAEIIKNLQDNVDFDNTKTISSSRKRNVAKAYGWWVARDCVSLAILKPVDFVAAKPQTRKFLAEFFEQVFINSQTPTPVLSSKVSDLPTTRNKGAVEAIFIKATRMEALAMGLVYFISETFRSRKTEDDEAKFFTWASNVAKQTLRTGVDIVPTL
ncbi:armadillo-type protein [Amylostereum chailletii]|nr:armadillo-type protein [Amylostereum chailletii]